MAGVIFFLIVLLIAMWFCLTANLIRHYLIVSLDMQICEAALYLAYHRTQILRNDVYNFGVAYQMVVSGSVDNEGVIRHSTPTDFQFDVVYQLLQF